MKAKLFPPCAILSSTFVTRSILGLMKAGIFLQLLVGASVSPILKNPQRDLPPCPMVSSAHTSCAFAAMSTKAEISKWCLHVPPQKQRGAAALPKHCGNFHLSPNELIHRNQVITEKLARFVE